MSRAFPLDAAWRAAAESVGSVCEWSGPPGLRQRMLNAGFPADLIADADGRDLRLRCYTAASLYATGQRLRVPP